MLWIVKKNAILFDQDCVGFICLMSIGEESIKGFLSVDEIFREEDFAPGSREDPDHDDVPVEELEEENEEDEKEEEAKDQGDEENRDGFAELDLLQLVQVLLHHLLFNVACDRDVLELVDGGVVLKEEGVQVQGGAGAEEGVAFQVHLQQEIKD